MKKFQEFSIENLKVKFENSLSRQKPIYERENELRSQFQRDYNRILHSKSYRRLKHKTQVFFATKNDHVCTRIEHVNHVSAISYTLSSYLGLNTELTTAIAIGHDIGHTPFGHTGEEIINTLTQRELGLHFWHEMNSLYFVDNIELLQNPEGKFNNLDLTYGVRDGIICHCGETDDKTLIPRDELIALESINKKEQPLPYTWEGCIVKTADKIAFLGRDIEDAVLLKIITGNELNNLAREIAGVIKGINMEEINNTNIIHYFMVDLCNSSSPEEGLKFSPRFAELLAFIKDFSIKNIYRSPRLEYFKNYAILVIDSIYKLLTDMDFDYDIDKLRQFLSHRGRNYEQLIKYFRKWLVKYSNFYKDRERKYEDVKRLYDLEKLSDYKRAVIDFIASMTDTFAIKLFDEIISF
jgi:dGTPase